MKELQNYTYCNFSGFQDKYDKIHGYLSGTICVLGILANIINTIVFTRKEMRWPTNVILTHMALIDICLMVEYLPFNYYYYFSNKKHVKFFTYYSAIYMKFHAVFSQIFHFTSCCLTLLLAIWRCIIMKNKSAIRTSCTMKRTLYAIFIIYFLCPIICVPFINTLKIEQYEHKSLPNGALLDKKDIESGNIKSFIINSTIYHIDLNLKQGIFIHYGVILKLLPCLILTGLSAYLIFLLISTKNKRKKLMTSNILLAETNSASGKSINLAVDKVYFVDRTTLMLIIILITFLLTEFPQVILGLLSAVLPESFFKQCYRLGDIMDILALINSGINFFFYYTMSRQFRITFQRIFSINVSSFCPQKNMHYSTVNKSTIGEGSQLTHV